MATVVIGLPSRCIVFAVRRESLGLRRRLTPWRPLPGPHDPGPPCPAWVVGAEAALVLECGVGAAAAARALSWLFATPWTGSVLSAGFCGALVADLPVLELVRATEVIDPDGATWPITWPLVVPGVRAGRLLTTPTLVGDPEVKKTLGERHDALAVDMEAAAIARLCASRRVPFACLRVVSDARDTPLSPELVGFLSGGRVRLGRLAAAVVRRPTLAGALWRLGRVTREGAEHLGEALVEVVRSAGGMP